MTDRKVFGAAGSKIPLINLIEPQKASYKWLLSEGIKELLAEISPIEDFTGKNFSLFFLDYSLGEPKYTPSLALEKGATEADELLGDVKKKAEVNGTKVKTSLIRSFGSPASEIVSYAEKEKVDLIVMGTKGRGMLKKILLGSTASGVVMNAPCTVMVVR